MTTKISDYQNRPVQVSTDSKVSRTSESASAPAEAAVTGSSPISITDQARRLASLEQAVKSLPVIDEQRVAEISLAIEEGRYRINPERIADKLLRMEQELKL